MANRLIPWLNRKVSTWIPDSDGTMVQLDPDAPKFVRLADYEDVTQSLEADLGLARRNEADARRSAAEAGQREARYMMIEQRLRNRLSLPVFDTEGEVCACRECRLKRDVLEILNSDPPIGDGFQSVKGPGIAGNTGPGRKLGEDIFTVPSRE